MNLIERLRNRYRASKERKRGPTGKEARPEMEVPQLRRHLGRLGTTSPDPFTPYRHHTYAEEGVPLSEDDQTGMVTSPFDRPSEGFQESYPLPHSKELQEVLDRVGGDVKTTGYPMHIAFSILKTASSTVTYCSEKGCHAHAKRVAPEDGKAYCDVCVSNKMKEPKPEKPEDAAKKIGVR